MGESDDILARIEEAEQELQGLRQELLELRALVSRTPREAPAEAAVVTTAVVPPGPVAAGYVVPPPPPAAPPPAPTPSTTAAAPWRASILAARIQLSEGRPGVALGDLEQAITRARDGGDAEGLEQLASELEGIARYRPRHREWALQLAKRARSSAAAPPATAAAVSPEPTAPAAPRSPAAVPARPAVARPVTVSRVAKNRDPAPAASAPVAPAPLGRSIGDLARDWDLLGPRGFAIIGGAVTALGISLLFVLASNRGWITPAMRVALGAVVSAAAVGAGLYVRRRYGQLQASLGAVGAGIAGGYASLAAAAARYDLVPDYLALPLAAVIAAVAVVIALAWSSQMVAAIGLVGAALAPALQAIDTGMTWRSAAFAVIVLAATVPLTVPRRWHQLLVGIAVVVGAQVAWLAHAADAPAGAGTAAVVAALLLVVLAAGVWLQLACDTTDLEPLATSFALAAIGLALLLAPELYEAGRDRGIALAAAAIVWAAGWAALRVRQPSLGLVLGVSALTLGAVASAGLLSGTGLAVTWAAESVLLSLLAWRLRDARLQVTVLVYGVLAGVHVLALDAPPDLIFRDPVDGKAAVSVAALALAAVAAGLLAPAETVARTETGLLAWLAVIRSEFAAYRDGLREALVFTGVAAGTYAAMLLLVSVSFRPGHLAATIVAAAVGAVVTAFSARRGSMQLVAASFGWLAVVFAVAALFDVPEFAVESVHRSYGGWALIAAVAGVLAGGFAFQVLHPNFGPPVVPGIAGVVALVSSVAGIALLSPPGDVLTSSWIGWRLLVPAAVFVALSAGVFRIARHRDLATIMWALGVVALLGSEWLVVEDLSWRAIAFAVTASALALLAEPLREPRLWLAGWGLALATAVDAAVSSAQPWTLVNDQPVRLAFGPLAAAVALFAIAALAWRDRARRDLVTCAWGVGVLALVDAESFAIQDATWVAAAVAATALLVAALERPLGEPRLWLGGWGLALGTAFATLTVLTVHWAFDSAEPARYAIAALTVAAALAGVSALVWAAPDRRDLVTAAWAVGLVSLIVGEGFLLGGGPPTAFAAALTGGGVALLAAPLREQRVWWGGAVVVCVTSAVVLVLLTPPTHFLAASASPGEGLWIAAGCLAAGIALRVSGPGYTRWIDPVVAVAALYLLSLGILELAERSFGGSVQTDFERGHVAVSSFWALTGLGLLVAGLMRDERVLRFGGLALFGLSLAKIFLYDLSTLSSIARALSFIAVGALVLAGGFFVQRLSSQMGPRRPRASE